MTDEQLTQEELDLIAELDAMAEFGDPDGDNGGGGR